MHSAARKIYTHRTNQGKAMKCDMLMWYDELCEWLIFQYQSP